MVNTIRRVIAAAAALCLAGSLVPVAQADPPEDVVRLLITCPTAAEVSAITGDERTGGMTNWTPGCIYSPVDNGDIYFYLWDYSVQKARQGIELPPKGDFPGQPVFDVSGWGTGAFQYESDGLWHVTYPLKDVSATLTVPLGFKGEAVALAQLFAAATYPRPIPTVPPRAFTATCPKTKAVGRIVGETMKVKPNDERNTCEFIGNEHPEVGYGTRHITFSIMSTFGSVVEARSDLELDFRNSPTGVVIQDFTGLGAGAFWWADASPIFLTWQLQKGVVAELYGAKSFDEARHLARLFQEVQGKKEGQPSTPTPSKPGLPSTGN